MGESDTQYFFRLKKTFAEGNILQRYLVLERLKESVASFQTASLRSAAQRFVAAATNQMERELDERERLRREKEDVMLAEVRGRLRAWSDGDIPFQFANRLVAGSAYWLTHPSGSPVRAPKHAERVDEDMDGWLIEFGANKFMISKFVEASSERMLECLVGFEGMRSRISKANLRDEIKEIASESVYNYRYERYEYYAPKGDFLPFGTQGIGLNPLAEVMIEGSGIEDFCSSYT